MDVLKIFEFEKKKDEIMKNWDLLNQNDNTQHIENQVAGKIEKMNTQNMKEIIHHNVDHINGNHNFDMKRIKTNLESKSKSNSQNVSHSESELECHYFNKDVYYNVKHLCEKSISIKDKKIYIINVLIETCKNDPLLSFSFLRNLETNVIEIPFIYENNVSKIKNRVEEFFNITCEEDGFILIEDTIYYICHRITSKRNINRITNDTRWVKIHACECKNHNRIMNCELSNEFKLLINKKEYENVFELFDEKNNVYPSGDIVYNVTEYGDFVTYYNLLMEQKNSTIIKHLSKKMNNSIIEMMRSVICLMNYEIAFECKKTLDDKKFKIFRCHLMIKEPFIEIDETNDINDIITELQNENQCIVKKDMNYVIFDMIDNRIEITDRIE